MAPERFSGATQKEPSCFAAERGPDPFGHTRALRGPFFDSKSQGPGLGLIGRQFSGATHKEQPCFAAERGPALLGPRMGSPWFSGATHKEPACFAAERGPDPFGHTRALEGPFFDSKSQAQGLSPKGRHT